MTTPSDFAPLLLRVARHLGLSVRPSGHDAQEWTVAERDGAAGTVVRLGDAGDVTLLRSFSPFRPEDEGEVGFVEKRQFATRVHAAARHVDARIDVLWQPSDLTAILTRALAPDEVDERSLGDALETLQEVVERTRSEASAVIQGVAGDAPTTLAPAPLVTGRTDESRAEPPAGETPPGFSDQLLPAILTTVCCCMPLGIVSIVFAARAQSLARKGDWPAAQQAANTAKTLWIVALVVGLVSMCSFGAVSESGF